MIDTNGKFNRFEFLNNWYEREKDRAISLEGSLNIPIGIISIVSTIHFYLVKEFDYNSEHHIETAIFGIVVSISIYCALSATFYLFKSYNNLFKGYEYINFPYATKILEYEDALRDYHGNDSFSKEFTNYLINKLAYYVDHNCYLNDQRSRFLFKAKNYIFVMSLTLILAFIPFVINAMNKPDTLYKIKVVSMPDSQKPSTPPPPPGDRHIKGDTIPKPPPLPPKTSK